MTITGITISLTHRKRDFEKVGKRSDYDFVNFISYEEYDLYNSTSKIQPSAFESEIPPLHKSAIYDKRVFRPPGARKREGVMTWQDIPL